MRLKRQMAVWAAAGMLMAGSAAFATLAPSPAATRDVGETAARAVESATHTPAAEGGHTAGGHEAAGEGHGGGDVVGSELNAGTLIVTIAIFICLFIVLSQTAWKPIMAGLKNREAAIRDSIEAAKKAKADAERTTRDLEAKMAEVQRQSALQLTQAKADAQRLADSIRTQAEAESAALKDRTLREIDAAKQQALTEINSHAAELGTAVARKILQRNVTVDDQQRLVEESLAQLAKTN
jgi:F-type H+-transporting ATPase subunit b